MDMGHSVWIGTGEGNMIVYEVAEHINFKTPTDLSSSVDTPSSRSGKLFLSPSPRNSSLGSRGRRPSERERSRSKSPRDKTEKPSFLVEIDDGSGKCIDKVDKKPLKRSLSSEISVAQLNEKILHSDSASTGTLTPNVPSPRLKHQEKKSSNEKDITEEIDSPNDSPYEKERERKNSVIEVPQNGDVRNEVEKDLNDSLQIGDEKKDTLAKKLSFESEEENSKLDENVEKKKETEVGNVSDKDQKNRPTHLKLKVNNRKKWLLSQQGKGQNFIDELDIALTQLNGVIDKAKSRNGCVLQGQKVKGKDDLVSKNQKEGKECNEKSPGNQKSEIIGIEQNGVTSDKDINRVDLELNQCNGLSDAEIHSPTEETTFNNLDIPYDIKEMSRHHKVNTWLSSLEETEKMEESISENGGEQDSVSLNESGFSDSSATQSSENHQNNTHISKDILIDKNKEDVKPQEKKTNSPEKVKVGSPGKLTLKKQNSNQSENGGMKNVKNNDISPQASSQPKSEISDGSSNSRGSRHHLKRLSERMLDYNRQRPPLQKGESFQSDCGSERLLPASKIVSNDPDVQYRLDFSGMYVETDSELDLARQSRSDSLSEFSMFESRRQSAMEEPFTPLIDKKFEAELNKFEMWTNSADNSGVTTPVDNKMFELMQTPSLMSRHISVNKVSRDRQDWSDLSSNRMSSASGRSSLDYNKVQEFLRTPSISSKASSVWSSYDEISTPSVKEDDEDVDGFGRKIQTLSGLISHTASNSSLCSMVDSLYTVDVTLQAKVKISDKPVRSFVKTR
jgi:hypothetical protein